MQGTAVDWDTSDKESRAMAFSLNAGPSTTKHCLKNVLGGVKDSASRQSSEVNVHKVALCCDIKIPHRRGRPTTSNGVG